MMKAMRSAWLIVPGMLMMAGCKDFPGADGRYATPARGGWDNFRAEAPASAGHENFRAEAPLPTAGEGSSGL
ncbi:MAG: hypothetical protein AB7F22_15415 [Reyranella sp.]|uniref:hypothetical protein n=1 Tax=Reyranella sp. TaxID=1929291 RepID=UPI003D0EE5C9